MHVYVSIYVFIYKEIGTERDQGCMQPPILPKLSSFTWNALELWVLSKASVASTESLSVPFGVDTWMIGREEVCLVFGRKGLVMASYGGL